MEAEQEKQPEQESGEAAEGLDDVKSPTESKVVPKSNSFFLEPSHAGRPKDEEPHVKKTMKAKKELVEYIVRVDLEQLGIDEEEFDDLQSLFQLFDHDMDGVVNLREACRVMKCLGFRGTEDQVKDFCQSISVDKTGLSMSFNEFLSFVSKKRREDPDENALMDVFLTFDQEESGKITEEAFRNIMRTREGIPEEEVNSMLEEYYKTCGQEASAKSEIHYKDFIKMLQS